MTAGHGPSTAGGPQARWGICTCGWTGSEQYRGPEARECAFRDAQDHVQIADAITAMDRDLTTGGA